MQHGAVRLQRIGRAQRDGQRLVLDLDQLQRVLGEIAVGRDHDRHRLADIAHLADRDRPALDIGPHAREQRRTKSRHVLGGDHGRDAFRGARGVRID